MEFHDDVVLRDVTYEIRNNTNSWKVIVTAYLDTQQLSSTPSHLDGYLIVEMTEVLKNPVVKQIFVPQVETKEMFVNIEIDVPHADVELWWPNKFGEQKLYTLVVSWSTENRNIITNEVKKKCSKTSAKTVNVGFRTIELIEEPLGEGNSFYFRINNVPIFLKGTNWIPLDILPEKQDNEFRIRSLLGAVKTAHMNVLRVWGGGVYESDRFYSLADEYGILIWQDMMFACAMYPIHNEFLQSVETEITQNIRRIQSHPSILLWAGNNENEAALVQNW